MTRCSIPATSTRRAKRLNEIAGYEEPMASMDTRVAVLTWMVAFLIAVAVAILGKVW